MTLADYLAILVLGVFGLTGVMGWTRWIGRFLLGVLIGCAVLIAVSYAGSIPAVSSVSDFFNDGTITPALTRHAEALAQQLGIETSSVAEDAAIFDFDDIDQSVLPEKALGELTEDD